LRGMAVEPLIDCLRDASTHMRTQAAKGLGELGDKRAVEPLITCLNDQESAVRGSTAEALGKLQDKRAVEPLVTCLKDEDIGVQISAIRSLGKLGDATVEPLIARLKEQENEEKLVRASNHPGAVLKPLGLMQEIVKALGELGDRRPLELLIGCLKHDSFEVQTAAIQALGKLGDKGAVQPLVELLPNWGFKYELGGALKKLDWKPESDVERVYFWICNKNEIELLKHFEMTKQVLLADAQSGDARKLDNALYTFIGLGREESISDLIKILYASGTKEMAETLINCGHKGLSDAARGWAVGRGYQVSTGFGGPDTHWGQW
jgi:HEAT repeats